MWKVGTDCHPLTHVGSSRRLRSALGRKEEDEILVGLIYLPPEGSREADTEWSAELAGLSADLRPLVARGSVERP